MGYGVPHFEHAPGPTIECVDARTGVASLINSAAEQDGETPVVRSLTFSLPAFMPLPVDWLWPDAFGAYGILDSTATPAVRRYSRVPGG